MSARLATLVRDIRIERRRLQLQRERLDALLSESESMEPIDRWLWLCRKGFYTDSTRRRWEK